MSENIKVNTCPEFPFFGAHYPDACCIDGYLWDLDKCTDGGGLYGGGEEPCPFCNQEAFIEQHLDEPIEGDEVDDNYQYTTRENLLRYIQQLREKYA